MLNYEHYEGLTVCKLFSESTGMTFYGEARCHEEDKDNYNPMVGEQIATARAHIALLRYCKNSLKNIAENQKHILDCATHSKKFNPKSNEYRLLKRNFYQTIEDIKTIEEEIKANQDYLKYYIGHH